MSNEVRKSSVLQDAEQLLKGKKDAAKFLERLLSPCEGKPDGHGWQKCRRCAAIHLLENRDKLAVRLLTTAIQSLALLPSQEPAAPLKEQPNWGVLERRYGIEPTDPQWRGLQAGWRQMVMLNTWLLTHPAAGETPEQQRHRVDQALTSGLPLGAGGRP